MDEAGKKALIDLVSVAGALLGQSALNDADCFLTLAAMTGFISVNRTFRAPPGRKSYVAAMRVPPSCTANP